MHSGQWTDFVSRKGQPRGEWKTIQYICLCNTLNPKCNWAQLEKHALSRLMGNSSRWTPRWIPTASKKSGCSADKPCEGATKLETILGDMLVTAHPCGRCGPGHVERITPLEAREGSAETPCSRCHPTALRIACCPPSHGRPLDSSRLLPRLRHHPASSKTKTVL